MRHVLILSSMLLSACELRVWGIGDGGVADSGASDYDAAVGIPFEGPLNLDDQRVMDLDPSALPAGESPCREPILVRVYHALDGDTLVVDEAVENGEQGVHVRMLGINTPEIMHEGDPAPADCYGPEAAAFTEGLATHYVYLTFATDCEDEYGRALAYVHVGPGQNDFFQRQLLRRGFARTYFAQDNPRYASLFDQDQSAADAANVGLWGACSE